MPLTHENIKTECDKIQAVKGNPGFLDVQDVIDAFIRGDEVGIRAFIPKFGSHLFLSLDSV